MKINNKKLLKKIFITLFAICIMATLNMHSVHATSKIPKKFYKLLKGKWYTQNSSGGYNIKFSRTRIKYYSRRTGKQKYSYKIKKVKKIRSGYYKGRYRLVFKTPHGVASFINSDKKAKYFDYYGCEKGYKHYSGSSSISRGKWKY